MTKMTAEKLTKLNAEAFDQAYKNEIMNALHEYYHTVQSAEDFRKRCAEIQEKALALLGEK